MKYTVYKVTNKINGKVYIGTHKTNDLDDNYMGSGKYLRYSINKHGIENFDKEILYEFDTPEEMFAKEAELVTEEFIAESNTYNLKVGGFGGFDYINENGLTSGKSHRGENLTPELQEKGRQEFANRLQSDQRYRAAYSKTRKKASQKAAETFMGQHGHGTFYNKKHSEETKKRIGAANAKHQKGKKNSQYGTCWIHNNRVSKKIDKSELEQHLVEGWIKGRKIKF